MALLDSVVCRLELEMTDAGKGLQFEALRPTLSKGAQRGLYARIAADLGVSEEAARASAHRLRLRFRALIREEILATVDDPADVEEEIQALFNVLGS